MKHITYSWLIQYANVNKHASYQDKLTSLYNEKNVYYLLEWLLFSPSDEELEMIHFTRSPSMIKNSYVDFTEVFMNQIMMEIAFQVYASDQHEKLLLDTAIHDLREYIGSELWNQAVLRLNELIENMFQQFEHFKQELEQNHKSITHKYNEQVKEIKAEHEDHEARQLELIAAQELLEQRMKDAPRKLLMKKYKEWPLVTYLHYKNLHQPQIHWSWLWGRLQHVESNPFINAIQNQDYSQLMSWISSDNDVRNQFLQWFPAYASKSLMIMEYVDVQNRQKWWLGLLNFLDQETAKKEINIHSDLWITTFYIKGIDEMMMKDRVIPPYLNKLVSIGLQDERQRKWLREAIILRYWDVFVQQFAQDDYQYELLSWVLCLDPVSLEQKLIRGAIDLSFIVERCCEIFSDGLKEGLDSDLMSSLFQFLTIHHIDFMYGYIQKMKEPIQLYPILSMEPSLINRIFSGKGVRSTAARKHIQPLFLAWLSHREHNPIELNLLKQLGKIYLSYKRDLLQEWLKQAAVNKQKWPLNQAELLEEILQIEWLGQPHISLDEHEQVKIWLEQHSDWIKFELDAPSSQHAVKYSIIRPGYKDLITDQILGRVWVRSEWSDPKEISSLLDDLNNL